MNQICTVIKDFNKNVVHIVLNKPRMLTEGDYIIDSQNDIYALMRGHLLPVDTGINPVGETFNIVVSSYKRLSIARPSRDFQRLTLHHRAKVHKVILKFNKSGKVKTKSNRTVNIVKARI